jgi:hypothetical protein
MTETATGAEARNDGQPTAARHARRVEPVGKQDQRVEILQLLGAERIVGFQKRHLEFGSIPQRFEVEIRVSRSTVGLTEVSG